MPAQAEFQFFETPEAVARDLAGRADLKPGQAVLVALLRPGGRLVSVMSPAWTYREDRRSRDFRALVEAMGGEWSALPEGSFKASDTTVDTGILVLDGATPIDPDGGMA